METVEETRIKIMAEGEEEITMAVGMNQADLSDLW